MNWRPQVGGSSYTRSTSWLVASVCPEFGLQFECSVLSLVVHQLSHPAAKRRAFLIWVQSGSSFRHHVANLALSSPVGDVTPPPPKKRRVYNAKFWDKWNTTAACPRPAGWALKSDAQKSSVEFFAGAT
ncbi:hypothetical protein R1flu_028774 [Riccia fluitans]|uniref:Uncharacterized protein n=1 Tax=Riccia fluitans TaxID=41844 RepID=A0ABD1XQI8_9MARC